MSRITPRLLALIGALLLTAASAHAQQYPARPIRLLVPFPPGGLGDVVARLVAQKLGESFAQTIVVDNRGGGGGVIAAETAARAPPDGYTMILVTASYTANAAIHKLGYDPVNDVTPVAMVGVGGNIATVLPSGPVANLKELIAYDKLHPGKLYYGSSGTGSSTHLATELLQQMAGTRMTHVPYKGTIAALNDLFGGQIHFIIGSLPAMIPQVKANRLRGIGVTTLKRSAALPDVPAIAETLPGYEAVNWGAVWGPKGLPRDIVARWNSEINRILREPDTRERLAASGLEAAGGTPEHLRDILRRDVAKWQSVVKTAGIKRAN
jgi:tripartite-type tricarboxylate transporter receptor subunit TctC